MYFMQSRHLKWSVDVEEMVLLEFVIDTGSNEYMDALSPLEYKLSRSDSRVWSLIVEVTFDRETYQFVQMSLMALSIVAL